ncbi:MAG: hypothetical protein ABI325_05680 [Ginsengibacter sp.]
MEFPRSNTLEKKTLVIMSEKGFLRIKIQVIFSYSFGMICKSKSLSFSTSVLYYIFLPGIGYKE